MTTFDQALPRLLRGCATSAGFDGEVKRACVVRDLEGRLRLAIERKHVETPTLDIAALTTALEREVGKYFVGPVLHAESGVEIRRLVGKLFDQCEPWPDGWPREVEDLVAGVKQPLDVSRWFAINRVLSKEVWVSRRGAATPPWPLVSGARRSPPVIVSFYSYKGGVGRTTLLALVARMLAKRGKKVAVVDLDLEAPGVGSFLGVGARERGVIDFLVDHVVTGSNAIGDIYAPANGLPESLRALVNVFSAGTMSRAYLEKLARLDFASTRSESEAPSPSEAGLRVLLASIKRELEPDYILLDARAGLHDLGGLSLHNLAHIDVLVSRSGPQALEGLAITLQTLARRRAPNDLRIVLVHSLVPADRVVGDRDRQRFQEDAYRLFEESIYDDEEEMPGLEDDTAAHFARPITRALELETARSIADVDEAVADSSAIAGVTGKIESLSQPEGGAE